MNRRDGTWRSGPPPFPGWWNASFNRDPEAWRWWNGARWSMPAYPHQTNTSARAVARQGSSLSIQADIEWRHYYPANARVPRVNPNIK
jgi:hypothetical protein